jgi:hypothetical protein
MKTGPHTRREAQHLAQRRSTSLRRRSVKTPLWAIAGGSAAGLVGTAAMDVLWFARYRRDGGGDGFLSWEFSSNVSNWDEAPAPAQVGKRLLEGLFERELAPRRDRLVNNVTHWVYGMLGGAQYGLVAGSLRTPRVRHGVPFGAGVWGTAYVVLPAMGLYRPIWRYDRATLAKDLSAHLVYGVATSAAMQLLLPSTQEDAPC